MPGYTKDKDAVLRRLRRVQGQVQGVERMVETDTYCIDVLTQISAATRALELSRCCSSRITWDTACARRSRPVAPKPTRRWPRPPQPWPACCDREAVLPA